MGPMQQPLSISPSVLAKTNIEESLEMVKISHDLFQKKLSRLKTAIKNETDKRKIGQLLTKAEKLYQEYRESLQIIEEFMDLNYRKMAQSSRRLS